MKPALLFACTLAALIPTPSRAFPLPIRQHSVILGSSTPRTVQQYHGPSTVSLRSTGLASSLHESVMGTYHEPTHTSSSSLLLNNLADETLSSTSSFEPSTTFEPVLNVPALSAFLVVFVLYALLLQRTSAIEAAVEVRTGAIDRLRRLKSLELTNEASEQDVEVAIEAYRQAYDRVEELRYVIPGVARIITSPATGSESVRKENEAAAQQFLGIEAAESATATTNAPAPSSSSPTNGKTSTTEGRKGGLSPVLVGVLAVVAASQIALLGLLTLDPMQSQGGL